MRAHIAHSLGRSEYYILSLTAERLRGKGFAVTSTHQVETTAYSFLPSTVEQTDLFVGIATLTGGDPRFVLDRWKEAESVYIPALLLIEDSLPFTANGHIEHVVRFDREKPGNAIDLINTKLEVAKNSIEVLPTDSLTWIYGHDIARLAISRISSSRLRGSAFIKSFELSENGRRLLVRYVDNYDSYIFAKPESRVSRDEYKSYFATGDTINKILIGESVRLMRDNADLDHVTIEVPFDGIVHRIDLSRQVVESYFEINLEKLADNELWRAQFVDPFLYNKGARAKAVDKFVQREGS